MTASIYNADHQNHITNFIPSQMDDYSSNAAEMRTQTSPGYVGSESLPTNMAGELERLRLAMAGHAGTSYWYESRTTSQYTDLKTLVDHIGATTENVKLNIETWSVTDDLTIPSNITLEFPRGAVISVAAAKTLTINGRIQAGLYQIFDGAGSFALHPESYDQVVPQWWGAEPGGAAAVNTTAIQASFDSLYRNGNYVYTANWWLPPGEYDIDDEVLFPTAAEAAVEVTRSALRFDGTITQTDDTKNGITFGKFFYSRIEGLKYFGPSTDQHAAGKAGITFSNSIADNEISIDFCYSGSQYGVQLFPSAVGSAAFNKINLGVVRQAQYNLHITCDGTPGNYFNSNEIRGGDFATSYITGGTSIYGIYITDYSYSNTWIHPHFASLNTDIYMKRAIGWAIIHPYFDTPAGAEVAFQSEACSGGTWIHGYSHYDDITFTLDENTRDNLWLGLNASTKFDPAIVTGQYALRMNFHAPGNTLDTGALLQYSQTQMKCLISDHHSSPVYQHMNKQAQGTTAVPTAGTYDVGAVVWNVSNIASGQTLGFTCKTVGTEGTLSGITGAVVSGSALLTVNDASDIEYGMYITVSGVAGSKVVLGVDGTTVTLSATANTSVSGAIIQYIAPTWQALPDYP